MAKLKLTKTAVDAAHPRDREYELRDTTVPGFLLKVTPAGRKIFMLQYLTNSGVRRKPAIGRFGELTVELARRIAQDWLAEVRQGKDPSAEKSAARTAPTVKQLCHRFIEDHSRLHNKPSTVEGNELNIKNHIVPQLGRMKVHEVTRADVSAMMTAMADRPGSVGLAVPNCDIVVVDDNGCEVAAGEAGEIWIGGPSVVKGYWNKPEADADSFLGGFWRSGDIGSIDADGFVYVFDRKKDMINRGGLKIFSAEVENVLAAHPAVTESAVVGKPCPVLGERVHAFVSVKDEIDDAALRTFLQSRLSDYKVPETFTISAEPLPRNSNGKILKRDLKSELLTQIASGDVPGRAVAG